MARASKSRAERLGLVKGGNAREDLALEELERGTAAGRDVRHLVGEAGLLDRSHGVTAANDGAGARRGDLSEALGNIEGAGGERLELEDAHRAVPHNGLARLEGLHDLLGGLRSVVEAHPAVRDGVSLHHLGVGVSGELVSDDNVRREDKLAVVVLGELLGGLGGLDEVLLNERRAGGHAAGGKEGEDHAAANDDLVALLDQGLEDGDLRRDLGAADDGSKRLLAVRDGAVKELKLLGKEEARNRRGEELGHALGRGVGAVGGAERVVDEKVERSRELLDEAGLVLLLLLVEAGVLKDDELALVHAVDQGLGLVANAVAGELDLGANVLGHALGARGKRELVLRAVLRAAKVRAGGDLGTSVEKVLQGRDRRADAGVVGDGLAVKRDVKVAADKDLLALELSRGEVGDRLLGHHGDHAAGRGRAGGHPCRLAGRRERRGARDKSEDKSNGAHRG
mmetsp:Transcript_56328/g.155511  ORF Transcript_56328/g.155511 Transcript_56328/m.155511 type:complete len:454 (+) Transcript_56328:206-1567(+)